MAIVGIAPDDAIRADKLDGRIAANGERALEELTHGGISASGRLRVLCISAYVVICLCTYADVD